MKTAALKNSIIGALLGVILIASPLIAQHRNGGGRNNNQQGNRSHNGGGRGNNGSYRDGRGQSYNSPRQRPNNYNQGRSYGRPSSPQYGQRRGYTTAPRQNYNRYNYAPPVARRGYGNAYAYGGRTYRGYGYGNRVFGYRGYGYGYNRGPRVLIAPPIAWGTRIGILPYGYLQLYVGGMPYFYYSGMFYRSYDNQYEVVRPPLGAVVTELPVDAQQVIIDGEEYFLSYGTYYRAYVNENDQLVYEVVGEQ